jgi:hypothetical protein
VIVSDSFVIADWTDPGTHPGRPIAGLHLHRSDDEAWIVLEGQLGFRVRDEERTVPSGGVRAARVNGPRHYVASASAPTALRRGGAGTQPSPVPAATRTATDASLSGRSPPGSLEQEIEKRQLTPDELLARGGELEPARAVDLGKPL